MKKLFYILSISVLIYGCQKSTGDAHVHDHGAVEADSSNTILYNQVMDIHDEVMPKMEELYNLKKDLQTKLKDASTPESKQQLTQQIAKVDSASNLMMDWMHAFTPPDESADQEQTRAYLEAEMEKVKRVREAILETLKEK